MKLQHVERCNVVYRNGHCQHYLCRQGRHLKTDASVGTVTQTLKTKICVIKDLLYLSAARGRPVGPVAGSLHSPRVREHLAAPSDWTHHISTNTDLFREKNYSIALCCGGITGSFASRCFLIFSWTEYEWTKKNFNNIYIFASWHFNTFTQCLLLIVWSWSSLCNHSHLILKREKKGLVICRNLNNPLVLQRCWELKSLLTVFSYQVYKVELVLSCAVLQGGRNRAQQPWTQSL